MGRDAQMQHMMSRLSPADRKTMKAMSMKMSPDEKMVDAKMMMSQHGMKHGK